MPTLWSVLTLSLAVWIPLTVCNTDDPIMLTPSSLTVRVGEDASFTCTPLLELAGSLINTIDPITGDEKALTREDPRLDVEDLPPVNSTRRVFTWLDVAVEDHGREFFCHFSNERSNRSTLYVIHGITVSIDQTSYTATEEGELVVNLNVGGHPITPSLTRDGNTVNIDDRISFNGMSLSFADIMSEDAGTYVLTLSNEINSSSVEFFITVRFAPVFLSANNVIAVRNNPFVINCSATAYPKEINITLFREEIELVLDEHNTYTKDSATDGDEGSQYKCIAVNDVGMTEHTITVKVSAPPGPVGNIQFVADDTKIVITWEAAVSSDVRFPVQLYEITIKYEDEEYTDSTTDTSIEVSRDDLEIPKSGGEFQFIITVTAVSEAGKGEASTKDDTAKFDSLESSSSRMVAQQLFSLLLLCTVLLML